MVVVVVVVVVVDDVVVVGFVVVDVDVVRKVGWVVDEIGTTTGAMTLEVAFFAGGVVGIVEFAFAITVALTVVSTAVLLLTTCGGVVILLSCCASLAFGTVTTATIGVEVDVVVAVVTFISTPFRAKIRPFFECSWLLSP